MKNGYIYIMTNPNNTVLYTGVTSDLIGRVYQHKNKMIQGFASKYNIIKLVYYETCDEIRVAIAREKQIKSGSRAKKIALVNKMNPDWNDLYDELF